MVARVYDAQVNFYDDERKKVRDIAHSLFDIGRIQCFVGDFSEVLGDISIQPLRHPVFYVNIRKHVVKVPKGGNREDAILFSKAYCSEGFPCMLQDLATGEEISV